jgi:hypothetical protein
LFFFNFAACWLGCLLLFSEYYENDHHKNCYWNFWLLLSIVKCGQCVGVLEVPVICRCWFVLTIFLSSSYCWGWLVEAICICWNLGRLVVSAVWVALLFGWKKREGEGTIYWIGDTNFQCVWTRHPNISISTSSASNQQH